MEDQPPSKALFKRSSTDSPRSTAIFSIREVRSGKILSLSFVTMLAIAAVRSAGTKAFILLFSLTEASSRSWSTFACASTEIPGITSGSSPALTASAVWDMSASSFGVSIITSMSGAMAVPLGFPDASATILVVIGALLGS